MCVFMQPVAFLLLFPWDCCGPEYSAISSNLQPLPSQDQKIQPGSIPRCIVLHRESSLLYASLKQDFENEISLYMCWTIVPNKEHSTQMFTL